MIDSNQYKSLWNDTSEGLFFPSEDNLVLNGFSFEEISLLTKYGVPYNVTDMRFSSPSFYNFAEPLKKLSDEQQIDKKEYQNYIVIGFYADSNPICIDELDNRKIITFENFFTNSKRLSMNTSISQLVDLIYEYKLFTMDCEIKINDTNFYIDYEISRLDKFISRCNEIDIVTANKDNYWNILIKSIVDNNLEHKK